MGEIAALPTLPKMDWFTKLSFPANLWAVSEVRLSVFKIWPVSGVGVRVQCPAGIRWPEAGGRPLAGGRSGGVSARQYKYRNYDDDDEDDDDYDFSNDEYCGLGACALVIEHEQSYGLGMDALDIGCRQTERYYALGMDALVIGRNRT